MGNGPKINVFTIICTAITVGGYISLYYTEGALELVLLLGVALFSGWYAGMVVAEADEMHKPDDEFPPWFKWLAWLVFGVIFALFWSAPARDMPAWLRNYAFFPLYGAGYLCFLMFRVKILSMRR